MKRLTVLLFSKNDIANAIGVVKSLYNAADEFVLIDSSDKRNREKLAKEKKKLAKLKVFTTVALGYPDPLRMYGLSKCTGKWVLRLDTDERLSSELKAGINGIITDTGADAFAIKRYERAKKGDKFFTWQLRLYKRSKASYKGVRHEHASIKGTVKRLEETDYYIEHHEESSIHTGRESGKLDVYEERLTYDLYNKRFMEYMAKLVRPSGDIEETFAGKYVKSMLLLYQKLGFKKSDQEISDFDYFVFKALLDMGYAMTGRGVRESFRNMIRDRHGDMKRMREWKRAPDSKEAFEISKIINTVGVTKFLKLDEERTIKNLNKRYKDKYEGIQLLLKLLAEQYRKNQRGARQ